MGVRGRNAGEEVDQCPEVGEGEGVFAVEDWSRFGVAERGARGDVVSRVPLGGVP